MNKFNKEDNVDGGEINIGPENFPIKLQFKIFQNKFENKKLKNETSSQKTQIFIIIVKKNIITKKKAQ